MTAAAEPAAPASWRNRIVGTGSESPEQLVANPRNWRIHPLAQRKALASVLDDVGWLGTVLVNRRTGNVVDGHLRVDLAIERGESLVPVTYVELTDEEEGLALASIDPIAAMAVTDEAKLRELLAEVTISSSELEKQLVSFAAAGIRTGESRDPDETPETPVELYVKPGDLWLLGDHRLVCGDATDPDVAKQLLDGAKVDAILTDPPYGIALDTNYTQMPTGSLRAIKGMRNRDWRPVIGDDKPFDAQTVLAIPALARAPEAFWFGADYYRRTLTGDDRDGSWIVWDKRTETTDTGFGSGFELVWSRARHKRTTLRHYWFGAFGAEASGRMHPTQKPTALLVDILERWTAQRAAVWDGFAGSGSTIIAAERAGRRCYAVEIDPAYVQVAVERWQTFTGNEARRG